MQVTGNLLKCNLMIKKKLFKKKKNPINKKAIYNCKGKRCGDYWEGEPIGITKLRIAA